jgi:hypothetical protein
MRVADRIPWWLSFDPTVTGHLPKSNHPISPRGKIAVDKLETKSRDPNPTKYVEERVQ